SRTAAVIGAALQRALNSTVLPILNRIEAMIHQAIGKAEQHALSALRRNRDEYMASLGSAGESEQESGSDDLTKGALDNNRAIVQVFSERASTIVGRIAQLVTTAAPQIIAQISQVIAQVRQIVVDIVRKAIQALSRIVQAVSSLIQSLVGSMTGALTRVV